MRSTSKGGDPEIDTLFWTDDSATAPVPHKGATVKNIGQAQNVCTGMLAFGAKLGNDKLQGILGTDQTGRFPVVSDRGHKYIFILYDINVSFIYGVPIKLRRASELFRAFDEAHDVLTKCGFRPVLHHTNNETNKDLIAAIEEWDIQYELVLPGNHRRNLTERAIQTFKAHFISLLNGLDVNFPEGAWDHLLPQTNTTLNMLRPCGVNP